MAVTEPPDIIICKEFYKVRQGMFAFSGSKQIQCCLWLRLQCHNTDEHGRLTMSSMKFFAYMTCVNEQYSCFVHVVIILFHITPLKLSTT